MDELEKEFQDYLEEMNQIVSFDAEICPTCGIDFTNNKEIQKVDWQRIYRTNNTKELEKIVDRFEKSGMKYFLQKEELEDNSEQFILLVNKANQKSAIKLLEHLQKK